MRNFRAILFLIVHLLVYSITAQTEMDEQSLNPINKRDLKNSNAQNRGSAVTCGITPNRFTIQIVSDSNYNSYDLKCADGCTGFYTVNITGGIGPFTVQWLGTGDNSTNTSQSWTNVCDQSSIQVLVTDMGQSVTCAASHVLNVPDRLRTINFTLTPPSCNNSCDGTATHSPVFGVPPYSYSWTNGETSKDASLLCIGMTTLFITDRNSCQFDTTITITTPPPIFPNITINEVSCNNACDGLLTSNPSGGTGAPFIFNWTNSGNSVSSNNSATNLCETLTYNLRLTDNSGCFIDTAITMADKIPMTINVTSTTNAKCSNTCDGQVTLNVSGGIPPYVSYDWYQGTFGNGTLQSFSGLTVNQLCPFTNYYVVVTDTDGCSDSLQINQLIAPPSININETHTDNACFGDNSGTININASGGTSSGTYNYFWTTTDGSGLNPNNQNQTNLSGGTYQVLVTDDIGCKDSLSITIAEPTLINANGVPTDITCFNLTDGQIDLSTAGGAGGFTWSWSSSDLSFINPNTEDLNGLDSGSYSVRITDVTGCFIDTTIIITKPDEIFVNGTITPVLCNSDDNAQINITPINGTGTYSYDWDIDGTGDFDDTQNQLGLVPNTYNLSVRDGNNCQKDTSFTVTEPDPISFTQSIIQPNCGQSNGSITATPAGGTPSYNFSWLNSSTVNVGNTATASGLPEDCYDLTITDLNNCTLTQQVCITDTPLPTATLTPTDASCNGLCDGSITINLSSGTAPYNTTWTSNDPGFTDPNTDNIFNLCAGNYTLLVTDATNCTFTQSVIVNSPDTIFASGIPTDITCFNLTDGQIDLSTTGGAGGFTWSWTSSDLSFINPNTEDLNGLDSGSYSVRITDVTGCFIDTTIIITKPDEIFVNGTITPILCNSDDNAQINITPINGTGTYSYDWDIDGTGDFDDTQNQLGLVPNTYNLSVRDGNNCQKDTVFTITEPDPISFTQSITQPNCGQSNGSITATPAGGTPSYNFSWLNSSTVNVGSTATASGLPQDCYDLTITDLNNCTLTQQVCITDTPLPTATLTPTDASCNGLCDGSITINLSSGTAPYNTTWTSTDPGFTDPNTDNIFNLCAGNYTLLVTDATNCTFTQSVTINEPAIISISDITQPITCNNGSDGSIDVTATGGTVSGNYNYSWSGSNSYTNTTEDISSLPVGNYNLTITDDNNCSMNANYSITEPTPIVITTSANNSQCNGSTGSINTSVTGGNPNYNYSWTNTTGTIIGGNSPTLSSQPSGTYNLLVTDINGCTETIVTNISDDTAPTLTIDNFGDVSCNGTNDGFINITATGGNGSFNYNWSSAPSGFTSTNEDLNLLAGNITYTISVTDASGCSANQSIAINEPSPITIASNSTDPLCNGSNSGSIDITVIGGSPTYSFDWDNDGTGDFDDTEDLNSLIAGTYSISILDNNNCPQSTTITLSEPTIINLTTSSTNSNCLQNDGSVSVIATNGTPILPNIYNYRWTPTGRVTPILGISATLNNQPAGCYDVLVTDANNCSQLATVCITDDNGPTLTMNATDVNCFGNSDGTVTLTITGGQTPYTPISWTGNTSISNGSLSGSNLQSGVYSVQVTDGDGCVSTISDTVNDPLPISITDVITNPNCNNGSDGSINITLTNTTGIVNYVWTGPPGFIDPAVEDLTNISAGQYCLTVTDANNCTSSQCFNVNEPSPLTINTTNNPTDCANNTGQLMATISGGTPTYIFNWINSGNTTVGTSANINNLGADTYTLTATDNNGCIATAQEIISIANAPNLSIISTNHVSCKGGSNGSVIIAVTGGTPNYTFNWNNLTGTNNPQNQNNLTAGNYSVIATDASGCTDNLSITINEPLVALSANGIATNAACNGGNTGAIDLTVTGGTPNYTFLWSNNGTNEDINGLLAGSYSVIVTDNNGCTTNDTTQIISPTPLNLITNNTNATCGGSNGTASVTVSGGNPTYNYSWTNVTNAQPGTSILFNNPMLSSLAAGSYQVVVTDINGCPDSVIIAVSNTNGPTVSSTVSDVLCFGGNSGAIDITVSGTPIFTYNWSGPPPFSGSTSEDISAVEAGTYTVSVTDGNSCITNQVITINGPVSAIQDNAIVTALTCYNNSTGIIDITPSGGTSPYLITWNGPNTINSNSEDLNNLSNGSYNLQILDNNNCSYSNNITVTQPDSIQITPTTTQPTCGVNDGQISVSVIGGTVTNNYTYSWVNLTTGNNIGNTSSITSLGAANYQVTVTDDNGCTNSLIISLSDDNAPPLSIINTNVDCFGNSTGSIDLTVGGNNAYSFDWDNDGTGDNDDNEDLFLLPIGTYNVVVTDLITGCIASASSIITEPIALTLTAQENNLGCFEDNSGSIDVTVTGGTTPYSFDWDNLTSANEPEDQNSLAAGNYTLTITDNNGCTIGGIYSLTQPLEIFTPAVITNNNCFGLNQGSIDITPINGSPNYTYTWTGLPPFTGSVNEDINNLATGNYNLSTIDNNGCQKDTIISISSPPALSFAISTTDASCNTNDGSASVIVTGGTLTSADYTYNWLNSGGSISTTNSINSVTAGTYLLSVTDDNGCQKDSLIRINNVNAPTITFDSLTNISCPGDNNGAIYLTISGGTAPYSQVWNPNGISLTEDLINITSGSYNITVTDAAGCISSYDTTLVEPSLITSSFTTIDATCDSCNGIASIIGAGGTGTLNYLWSNNSTTNSIQNMCAGVYPVLISDENNCSITTNVTINNNGGPSGENILLNNVTCFGGNNGSVTINAIGGTAPYTYFWPHNGSTLNTQSNLIAGIYIVQMKDLNGCLRNASVTITEPNSIVATSFVTPSNCGNNDGSMLLTITGGNAPYNINWDGGLGSSTTLNNLTSGIYSNTITDNNLCSAEFVFNLPDVLAPAIALTTTDITCNGDNDGSINSSVTGNTGTINYQWFSNNSLLSSETSSNITNLGIGIYTLAIVDNATGCQNQTSIAIVEPDSLTLALPTLTDASCNTVCDASVLVNPIGGTLGYSYLWNNGETTQTATSLCVGINTVLITDNNNCTISQTIISEATNNLDATITNTTANCGECNGTSTIVPSGGSGNYSLLWADGSTGMSHDNLCAGIHPFEVIDNNGCSIQLQSVISNTGGPDNETINKSDVSCNGGNDGGITVSPSGGTLPYSYLWIPTGVTTNTINGLEAGTYYLEVTDSNNCTRVVPVEINEPEKPSIETVISNENCGSNDGNLTITINGNTAPYTISWSGPNGFTSNSLTLNNLEAGLYIASISDVNGCITTHNYNVNSTNTPNLTMSKTDISCFGLCDGSATVSALPMGSYTYNWIGETITTPTINNLCAGDYIVEVQDINTGCIISQSVEIEGNDSISIEVPFIQNPTCFELCDGLSTVVVTGGALTYSYNWLTGSNTESQEDLCVGDSKVIVTDANGCMDSLTIKVFEPTEIIISIDSTINSECVYSTEGAIFTTVSGGTPGYSYNWETNPTTNFNASTEDIIGLLPTQYILTVTDNNNCIKIDSVGIDTNHIVIANAGLDTNICIGNCATLVGTGEGPSGITYEWFDENGNTLSNIDSLTICPDTAQNYNYILEVSDAFCFDRDSINLLVLELPEVNAGNDITGLTGSIVILGGNPTAFTGDTYVWSPSTNLLFGEENTPNPQLELNEEGEYVVTVVDTNGCVNSDTIFVRPIPDISFPNGFTPNSDGSNDYWRIDFITEFPQSTVEIYNRWGQLLFRSIGYNEPWDGMYKGKQLPVGTYYYIIELNDPNFPDGYTGPITIMR